MFLQWDASLLGGQFRGSRAGGSSSGVLSSYMVWSGHLLVVWIA